MSNNFEKSSLNVGIFGETAMRKFLLAILIVVLSSIASSHLTPAYAQSTRTWVSGTGSDANDCSRPTPCATFAGAIAKTSAGGEINCLDPGGFGSVTISKAISIICDNTQAGILVSGGNGILVNAGATDVVSLIGLDINGGGAGSTGISFVSGGQLRVGNSHVYGFTGSGISFTPNTGTSILSMSTVTIESNTGTGILIKPTGSASAQVTLGDLQVRNNGGDGIMGNGNVTSGSVSVVVNNSVSSNNAHFGFIAFANGAGKSNMAVINGVAFQNGGGVGASGGNAAVRFGETVVTGNATGVSQSASNTALSYGNNNINGNTADGTFGTVGLQ